MTPLNQSNGLTQVCLEIPLGQHVPSKKNRHWSNGKRVHMDVKIKERMRRLESAIESALYSCAATIESGTHSECLKQLRMLLSSLCDDSIREIPSGSWDVEKVPKGKEGLRITIERIQ